MARARTAADSRQPPTVLVVEDEVVVRMMIADELRNAGFKVVEASNAREGLDLLRYNNNGVRVLFSDVRMPGSMDGAELARVVRTEFPSLKVVLTSGNSGPVDGADHHGFFPKPYRPAQVVKRLKALLD